MMSQLRSSQRAWGRIHTQGSRKAPLMALLGAAVLAATPASAGDRGDRRERPEPVTVVNSPARPVPVAIQGTATVGGAVSITGTPTVNVGNLPDVTRVEVVNAPAAGAAPLAPTAASQLVDLILSLPCPNPLVSADAHAFDSEVRADGVRGSFSVPADKSLIVTDVGAAVALGSGSAGQTINFALARASATTYNSIAYRTVTLDSEGTGTVSFTFGHGTRFQPGTTMCLRVQNLTTAAFVRPFATSHGFLAPDN
jgi:hypothetical protein